jgi:hypothetical protein
LTLDQTTSSRDPLSFVHVWIRFFGSCLRINPLRLRAVVSNGRNRLDSLARPQSELADKPSVVPNCWIRSISVQQIGTIPVVDVLLGRRRKPDATRTSDTTGVTVAIPPLIAVLVPLQRNPNCDSDGWRAVARCVTRIQTERLRSVRSMPADGIRAATFTLTGTSALP